MRTGIVWIAMAALLVVPFLELCADVTLKSTFTSKGLVGLLNMEGTEEHIISHDKARTNSSTKMTSKVMKFFGAGKPQETADIIRVDKELIWNLDMKEKKYEEMTFAQIKQGIEAGLNEVQKKKEQDFKKNPEDSIQLRTEIKVDHTGKTQKIAGYSASETIITTMVYGKNSESNETGVFKLILDTWNSEEAPGQKEFQEFYRDMASKLGVTGYSKRSVDGILTSFGIDPREIQKHASELKGVTLMSTLSVEVVADSTSASANKKEKSDESAKAEDKNKDDEKSNSKLDKLGGLFGKKKNKDKESESKEADKSDKNQQGGPVYLVQFTNTVTEISTGSVAASEFEIPADFKKK